MVRRVGEDCGGHRAGSSRASRRLAFSWEQVGALVQVGDGRWTGLSVAPALPRPLAQSWAKAKARARDSRLPAQLLLRHALGFPICKTGLMTPR